MTEILQPKLGIIIDSQSFSVLGSSKIVERGVPQFAVEISYVSYFEGNVTVFTKNFHKNDMKLLSRDGKCSVGNIFGVSDICNQKRRVK